jgi:hypothetical protein
VTFEELLREAEADPEIVGVVLSGSRGKDAFVTEHSDYDVWVIVRDERRRAPHRRGGPLDVVTVTLADFERHPPDYAFAHVTPLLDKGGIAELLAAKGRVDPASAAEPLDGYVNFYYRSAKNARDGRPLEVRFDAAESVPYFLEFLFRAHGRVRPYNKWLRWELENHPLEPPWNADELLPRLERILAGDEAEQQALFRDAEQLARARGLGEVIDGWEPDVPWLRGEASIEG